MTNVIKIMCKVLLGCILFVGLPLIGWGILDLYSYFINPVRVLFIISVVIMQIIIVVIDPEIGRQGETGKTLINRQKLAIVLLQIISLTIIFFAPFTDRREFGVLGDNTIGRMIGLGIFIIGFTIMNWAEHELGKYFSIQVTVQKEHKLLTKGLFKYIRNPRYLGIIMNNIGIAFIFRSWITIILVIILIAVLIWRIIDEEKLMENEFGEDWTHYKVKTWRLIPYLY
jgi:protein-S-isoprenylcysteine O-methyltransferase Ste14